VSGGRLPKAGMGHGAACLDGRSVLLVGGLLATDPADESDWGPAADVAAWVAGQDAWSVRASLATPRYCHTMLTLPGDELLVLGGLTQGVSSDENLSGLASIASVERRRADGSWSLCAPLLEPVAEPAAALLADGRVLVCGGYDEHMTATAAVYDPALNHWEQTTPMAQPRAGHQATTLRDGRVMVVGGQNDFDAEFLASAELWDPTTGAWTTIQGPRWPRSGHTLTPLDDGRVLVAGGMSVDDLDGAAEIWSP
jgi:N-acetylneuraminic acid mutarotase